MCRVKYKSFRQTYRPNLRSLKFRPTEAKQRGYSVKRGRGYIMFPHNIFSPGGGRHA